MTTPRLLRRILLGLILLILLAIVLAGAVVANDIYGSPQSTDVTNVEYLAADGTRLQGYLALPEGMDTDTTGGEMKFPAVLMVHEWWGLNSEMPQLADLLAKEGYIVLAPDTYRGRVVTTVPAALVLRLTTPKEQIDADMQAAYDYLIAQPGVDAERVGVIGFCYGGGVALRYATQNPDIAATVDLYGEVITDPQAFGALLETKTPVLGIFGALDQTFPAQTVSAFEQALSDAGIPHTVTTYPGVGHAFVKPDALDTDGAPRDAWQQIQSFLEATLKPDPEA